MVFKKKISIVFQKKIKKKAAHNHRIFFLHKKKYIIFNKALFSQKKVLFVYSAPLQTRPSRFRLADAHLSFRLPYSFPKLRLADAHLSPSCFLLADAHLSFRLTDSSP